MLTRGKEKRKQREDTPLRVTFCLCQDLTHLKGQSLLVTAGYGHVHVQLQNDKFLKES